MILDFAEGEFPHPRVELAPLTVGALLRLQRLDPADPVWVLHVLAASMRPAMTVPELEALPGASLGALTRLMAAAREVNGELVGLNGGGPLS